MSAQAEVYTSVLGTANINISLDSLITKTTRTYATAADLRAEVNNARVWGGMHFRSSTTLGQQVGLQVATNALANYFGTAVSTSTHAVNTGG